MRSDQALQYHNTDVTILNNGIVYAQFSRWTALTQRSDLFGRAMNGDDRAVGVSGETIRSGEFVLTETITKPLFILPFGRITSNDTA
ncbi:unnamed protein product [Anisakis simplex]|uniref:MacB_PCD domain-containing protein n=1 Tax=Anisakis simplex TaxID=6269 RepID=A0A0M3KG00_ANISI|nr:unnamed protein product [Anisakis simplex]